LLSMSISLKHRIWVEAVLEEQEQLDGVTQGL